MVVLDLCKFISEFDRSFDLFFLNGDPDSRNFVKRLAISLYLPALSSLVGSIGSDCQSISFFMCFLIAGFGFFVVGFFFLII